MLPWLQTLEWDFERSAVLVLLPPALWTGRRPLSVALARLLRAPQPWRFTCWFALAVLAVATATSSQPAASLVEASRWILIALGAALAGQLAADKPARATWLLGALAGSGAIATFWHWFYWKNGAQPESAFYPHHRLMGLHLMGASVAATAFAVTAVERRLRQLGLLLGMLTWGGLLWTGGRSPLLALGAGLALWFILAPATTRKRLALVGIAHLAGGLLLSAALPADRPWLGWTRIWQRTIAPEPGVGVTSMRADFWQVASQRIGGSPWLGRGPDAYRYLEPKLEGAQPHNVILQSLLDVGIAGTLPFLALVTLGLVRGARRMDKTGPSAGFLALATASLVGGLLDGYFYHLAGLFAAALAVGVCLLYPKPGSQAPAPQPTPAWAIPATTAAVVVLLHTWLFYHVARAPAPAPDSAVTKTWFHFPSCTLGLERWIEAWRRTAPDQALALSRHAQIHSPNADFFRVQTAGLLLQRGDRTGALRELDHALAIAPWQMRPVISELRQKVAAPSP